MTSHSNSNSDGGSFANVQLPLIEVRETMKQLKSMLIGLLLVCSVTQPVFAETLTQADIDFIFNSDAEYKVGDLVPLSPEELESIEGEYWALYWRRIARGVVGFYNSLLSGRAFGIGSHVYRIQRHGPHHKFHGIWGQMKGYRKHWQVIVTNRIPGRNSKGEPRSEKGSDVNHRIPYGREYPPPGTPGNPGNPPKPKITPYSLSVERTPSTSTPSSDTRTPSSELIALLVEETIEETKPEPLRARRRRSASNPDDLYIPSDALRGFIMDYVMPTKAEVCLHVGGPNC